MRTDFKFLLIFLSLAQAILAAEWNYEQQGADWTDFTEPGGSCKSGKSQSPIDLKTPKFDNNLKGNPMVFNNYDKDISESTIVNNGHTIQMTPKPQSKLLENPYNPSTNPPPTISGGGLDGTFVLAQLHFHWGDKENQGSEHKIEGKAFPMEMHLVHFNKKYTNLARAVANKDGLAVLGFFYEIDKDGKDYEIFKKLNTPLKTVEPGTKKTIQNFNLKKLLPDNPEKEEFYRYTGSLTTPGCNEVVTWTVFKDPLKLHQELMDEFRNQKLGGDQEGNLVNNFRIVQPLHGRTISANFDSSGSSSPKVFWAMLGINAIALTFLIGW